MLQTPSANWMDVKDFNSWVHCLRIEKSRRRSTFLGEKRGSAKFPRGFFRLPGDHGPRFNPQKTPTTARELRCQAWRRVTQMSDLSRLGAICFTRRTSRCVPAALVLAIVSATVVALSAIAYRVGSTTDSELRFLESGRPPTFDEAFIACPIEHALRSHDTNDVIFLGDSVCQHGIDPVRFEKLTGITSYNLGCRSYFGRFGYWLTARAYLLKHPKPRAVVLCLCAMSFHADPDFQNGEVPRRFIEAYGPEVGTVARRDSVLPFIRFGARAIRNWISPEADIRDLPLDGIQKETFRMLRSRTDASRGYVALAGPHGPLKVVETAPGDVLIRDEWDEGVRRLAEECASAGVPFLIRFCPLSTDFERARDYSPIERWADGFQKRCPHTAIGRPVLVWYDFSLSWDRVHLNNAGVEKFMPLVAKDVERLLAESEVTGR
jgi:hypothetical protein